MAILSAASNPSTSALDLPQRNLTAGQPPRHRRSAGLHCRKNVVSSAIDNSSDSMNAVDTQRLLQGLNH